MDELFKFATGWLWYTPEVALDTPIPLLELARDGKLEFLKAIFGSKDDAPPRNPKEAEDRLLNAPPNHAEAAVGLLTWARARASADQKRKGE